jgi:hypothetical protein
VLLAFADVATAPLQRAAAEARLPLTVQRITSAAAAALYGRHLVLVRPDGHVAWRGDEIPANPAALIDTIRGAGARIAARRTTAPRDPPHAKPASGKTAAASSRVAVE